eukprot:scaffold1525_cov142-Cylindrotheca_fusiformis.AAC.164
MSSYLEAFCSKEPTDDWKMLPTSTQEFLLDLGLPSIHPFCDGHGFVHPMGLPMGPPETTVSAIEKVVTMWYFYIPPIMALVDLWVRLLSVWIAPLSFLYLLCQYHKRHHQYSLLYCSSIFASWILMTDDQYIIQFGRSLGFLLLIASLLISQTRLLFSQSIYILAILSLLYPLHMDDPEEIASIQPGLYFSKNDNPLITRIVHDFQQQLPVYADVATPWMLSGDARTGLPYLLNSVASPKFHRVWLPTVDDEFLALDIAFPRTGHDPTHPLYLVFHGLNGGSEEGYVMDLVISRLKQGSTVVVLVARGMMNTPIQGWTISHGARTVDAHSAAQTLQQRVVGPEQTLAGVGYSLGAIVLNNYVATYGGDVALDVSVSISGGIACQYQKDYRRSQLIWQPLIAEFMKKNYLDKKWGLRLHHQLGSSDYKGLMRASSVVEVDAYAGAKYNGFKDSLQFYNEMSAVDTNNPYRKHIGIPHLILHAFDDPISTWRNNASNDPSSPLHPATLVNKIEENLVLLLTTAGGHVGWPMGWWPNSWKYMNDYVAAGFVDSYEKSQGRTINLKTLENLSHAEICVPQVPSDNLGIFDPSNKCNHP